MAQTEAKNNPKSNPKGWMTVLVARFSAIGDVAMTIPALYGAAEANPDVRFVMITRPALANIFVNAPKNLILEPIDLDGQVDSALKLIAAVNALHKKYRFDHFIDLHDVIRTRLISLWLKLRGIATTRLDKCRRKRRALTRPHNKKLAAVPSQISLYKDVFLRAKLSLAPKERGVFAGRFTADPAIFKAITEPKKHGETWIAIAPFAAHKGKIYPPEKMFEVARLLTRHPGVKLFLCGGRGYEAEMLQTWAARLPNTLSLAGKKYGFATEMALFNHLDLMVSMDSGNMHLAAISSAEVVSIWGATHPLAGFTPWQQDPANQIQLALPCRPCSTFGNKPCRFGNFKCLNIPPTVIYNNIAKKLSL